MSEKLPKARKPDARNMRTARIEHEENKDKSVVINLTVPNSTYQRLGKFKKSMGMLNEHEAIRLGISIMLDQRGF